MTYRKLSNFIAKIEGKKSQVKVGDVREIMKILVDLRIKYLKGEIEFSVLDILYEESNRKFKK